MKIKRYYPAFVEGFDDEYADVLTKEELLNVPFVSTWAEDSRFEELCIDEQLLVAFLRKSNGERSWYVVASFVEGAEEAAKWFNKARYIR